MSKSRTFSAYLFLAVLARFTFSLPVVPVNSPSLSLIQDSPALKLSQATDLSLPTSDIFTIPKTVLTLKFHEFGPLLDPTDLKSFFVEASNDIQHQIDQSSVNAAFSERWYNYQSDDGLVLELWSRSVSLEWCVSLGELRNVINGLSLYMIQRRSRAVRFQVIQNLGATKAIIMNKGSIRQDIASSTIESKREIARPPLVQYSSMSSATGVTNMSTLSLPTADEFPIPHTDYTLRLGNLGSYLHLWDLESLLVAVSAAIKEEITAHGRNARLPSTEYSKSLGGLQLWIQRMPWAAVNLAWAELAIIAEGLWLYIVNEGHDREAFIDVINHVTGRQVALGWIGKPPRPLEHSSSSGAVRRDLHALASR